MECLCKGARHYEWGTEYRLEAPDGSEETLILTNEQKAEAEEDQIPIVGEVFEVEEQEAEYSPPEEDNDSDSEPSFLDAPEAEIAGKPPTPEESDGSTDKGPDGT